MAQQQENQPEKDELQKKADYLSEAKKELLEASNRAIGNGFTVQGLLDAKLKFDDCMTKLNAGHDIGINGLVDRKAHWLGQRECGYLTPTMIGDKEKIGTDNLQQCVAVIIDGDFDRGGGRNIGFAHFDRFTTSESLEGLFAYYERNVSVILYGARSKEFSAISEDNIKTAKNAVLKACAEKGLNCHLEERVLSNAHSSKIIYNPENKTIEEGVVAGIGWQTKAVRSVSRNIQDQELRHDIRADNIVRNSNLRDISLRDADRIDLYSARELLLQYGKICQEYKHTFTENMSNLGTSVDPDGKEMAKFCAEKFTPFAKAIHQIIAKDNPDISMNDIYAQKPKVVEACQVKLVMVEGKIARDQKLQEQLGVVEQHLNTVPSRKDMDDARVITQDMIAQLTESEKASKLGYQIKEIDLQLKLRLHRKDMSKKEVISLTEHAKKEAEKARYQIHL